jgi:hypothetical protein
MRSEIEDNLINTDDKATVKLRMGAGLAKEIVKAIENTDEQAIFVLDKHGLFVRVADPLHARVVELMVEPKCFDLYEFHSPPKVGGQQIRLGVVISRLKDITKTLVKKDCLDFEYVEGMNRVTTMGKGIQRTIRLIRSELMNDIPEIKVAHLFSSTISSDILKPFLKASNVKGGMVDIITDNKLILSSETDEGTVQITLTPEEAQLNPLDYISMTSFSVEEIIKATSTSEAMISIQGKQNAPVEFRWNY